MRSQNLNSMLSNYPQHQIHSDSLFSYPHTGWSVANLTHTISEFYILAILQLKRYLWTGPPSLCSMSDYWLWFV